MKRSTAPRDSPSPPPPTSTPVSPPAAPAFVGPSDALWPEVTKSTFPLFHHSPRQPDESSSINHTHAKRSLKALLDEKMFSRNIVRVGKTYIPMAVQRVLLADEGVTYLYLGLRLFSIPWNASGDTFHKNEKVLQACNDLYQLNGALERDAAQLIKEKVPRAQIKGALRGARFNLALINFIDPLRNAQLELKDEPHFGMGPMAVAWHRDQYTSAKSTVSVYNCVLREHERRGDPIPWSIGVKRAYDRGGSCALKVPLDHGDCYHMLYTCNQDTQHSVIQGTSARFSSTHRQGTCDKGTLEYILGRARTLDELASVRDVRAIRLEDVELAEDIHTEIEFDWIRQFWVQGSAHADAMVFWRPHMNKLERTWTKAEEMTAWLLDVVAHSQSPREIPFARALGRKLKQRASLRREWDLRYQLPVYKGRPEWAPLQRPDFTNPDLPLPYALEGALSRVKGLLL